jgi:hypothetical protein
MQPLITLFTAPKPFRDAHIATIQTNAILSWLSLKPEVEVVLVGEEEGVADVASKFQLIYQPAVRRNAQGTPLISSIFEIGRKQNQSALLAYVNADIILMDDFVDSARQIMQQCERFLVVGQRWDMDIREPLEFSSDWQSRIKARCLADGRLHTRGGSDYFIYPRECFQQVPDFAVGRAGWDNWMFYEARKQGWACVDATKAIRIIHQDHDYAHLPGGQSHYRLPETTENVRLAGGRRTIFTLQDVNYEYHAGRVHPFPLNWKKIWREIEIFPLVSLHAMFLGQLFFGIFHPGKAYWELRAWVKQLIKRSK